MSWRDSRKIIERIIVEGDLVLLTPTSLGNGNSDGLTDMSLLLDEVDGYALLSGTSIAGALRNYLRECLFNFEVSEESKYKDDQGNRLKLKDANGNVVKDSNGNPVNKPLPIVTQLFGSLEDDDSQSYLIIDDALSTKKPTTELRDGVRIVGKTRIAKDKAKFDLELLESGTTFKLRFELLICEGQNRNDFISAFANALQGFEKGEIHIGVRKRRGYGECKVENWTINSFDLKTKQGLLAWLGSANYQNQEVTDSEIANGLKTVLNLEKKIETDDKRAYFELNADFALDGSILIRSGSKLPNVSDKGQPDTVHLRSKKVEKDFNGKLARDGQGNLKIVDLPTNSGTSLAGVLRHRAFKIINTLSNETIAQTFTEKMFGDDDTKKPDKSASRLEVRETEIDKRQVNDLVQTRVKIDRFTGGAMDTALFDAAPVFSDGNEKAVRISLRLRKPMDAEIGLLLLLLKDLWTSDLAIGGESSIGRGRLKGISACLNYKSISNNWAVCLLENTGKQIEITGNKDRDYLNDFVTKYLKEELEKLEQNNGQEN